MKIIQPPRKRKNGSAMPDRVSGEASNKKQFIIGASGTTRWRKGDDLFLQVARYLTTKYPAINCRFIWVGKILPERAAMIQGDIEKLGLTDKVTFVGEQANPHTFYQDFDVFLITSREDPFPLVCIEVGMLGKPIICFQGATGTEEVLKNGGGFIVPYLDTEAMAEKVKYYYNHPEKNEVDGALNKEQFSVFTPEIICPKILKVIENNLR